MFDFIVRFIGDHGYVAIVALMAVENIFPPIPSELIMPLAGFTAASGKLKLFAVLLAGTAGSVAGTVPWYYAGRLYGRKRLRALAGSHGRWVTVKPDDIDKALRAFERHGRKAVLFGRLERVRPDWLRRGRGGLSPEQGVSRGFAKHCFAPAYRFALAGANAPCKGGDESYRGTARRRNAVPGTIRPASTSQVRANTL